MAISGVFVGLVIFVALLLYTFRVLREYERGVIFTLGRFWKVKGPGLIIVIPVVQQMERVDLRVIVMDVPTQDVISRDNVSVKVNAVAYYRVIDPERAVVDHTDLGGQRRFGIDIVAVEAVGQRPGRALLDLVDHGQQGVGRIPHGRQIVALHG